MTWELNFRRFVRSVNSKYIYGCVVSSELSLPPPASDTFAP